MLRRGTRLLIVGLLVLGLFTLSWGDPELNDVVYRLEWDLDRVSLLEQGGWETVNDLGYRVRVERGFLTSYSMELVECPDEVAGALDRMGGDSGFLGAPLAQAGHPGIHDATAVTRAHIESLALPSSLLLEVPRVDGGMYCQAHYLVARADREALGETDEVDMYRLSLFLEGSYVPPGSGEEQSFRLETRLANGALRPIDLGSAPVDPQGGPRATSGADAKATRFLDTGERGARVVIRRSLGSLFDGVDLATASSRSLERNVLTRLLESTEITILPEVPEDDS